MRRLALAALLIAVAQPLQAQSEVEALFDNADFRRCVAWMLEGYRGALIQNPCVEHYNLPAPSLVLCARKVRDGFESETDRETCAIVFDEQAKKTRAGYIR